MSRYQLNALFLAHAGPVVGVHEAVQVGAARASNRSRLPHDGATDRNGVNLNRVKAFSQQTHSKKWNPATCSSQQGRILSAGWMMCSFQSTVFALRASLLPDI